MYCIENNNELFDIVLQGLNSSDVEIQDLCYSIIEYLPIPQLCIELVYLLY